MLARMVTNLARAPVARYVNDFFGCSRKEIYSTGDIRLTVLGSLSGILFDDKQGADDSLSMMALGSLGDASVSQARTKFRLDEDKAKKWHGDLLQIYACGILHQDHAVKHNCFVVGAFGPSTGVGHMACAHGVMCMVGRARESRYPAQSAEGQVLSRGRECAKWAG